MGEETVRVDPNEDLDTLIARLKQSRSKDVVLVMPNKTRALQTLDNFYALRKAARDEGMNLTFDGGNKTMKGLAKLLGFQVRGGDGGEDDIADFGSNPTSQITMPPSQTQPQMSARPAAFDGPPSGFMVQPPDMPPARNGAGRGEQMPPPQMSRTPEDFFNEIPDMSIPSIQPPPVHNDNGFGGNDQVLTRNNAANFFDVGGPGGPPPAAPPRTPEPAFDFGGGGSPEGGRTMSYEEAMTSGLFGGGSANLSEGFQFDTPAESQPTMSMSNFDDDDMGIPPVGADNAAARFRGGGARRDDDLDEPTSQRRGGRAPKTKAPRQSRSSRGVAVPAGLAALGTRVNKILNPVERTSGGGMMKADISPVERERRRKQSQRTTFFAFLAVSVLAIAIILAILFSFGAFNPNPNNDGPGTTVANATRMNLTYKTTPVSNTVSLLLDPSNTGGTNATQGQTNPATAGNGAGTGGRLPVSQISAADVQAKADYPAFGSKQQPTGTAQGTVTFSNATQQAVGYGAGAQLFRGANGVTYRLRDGVTVPAGNVFAGTAGRATGVVVADRAGSIGNLPSGFAIYLGTAIGAQAGAIAGGNEQTVKVVSPADQEALKKQLVEKAKADALASMKNQYNPATQDMQIATGEPSCQFTKNPGDVADSFSGTCSVKPIAYVYSKDAFQKAVQEQLANGSSQKIDPATLTPGNGQLKTENNRLIYDLSVTGSSYAPIDLSKFREAVANKTRLEVTEIVSRDYPSVASFDFSGDKLPEAGKIEVVTTPSDAVPATATPMAGSPVPGSPGAAATGGPEPSATPKP